MQDSMVIRRIDTYVYRCPVDRPVATSFGIMRDRPAVFVRIEDQQGGFGWGEIFANWPAAGAEHRANLLMKDVADLVLGVELQTPRDLFHKLESETRIRAIQCGELGPFRQVTAGLDIALWDLFSRRAGQPLGKFINPSASASLPAYASGIQVRDAEELIGSSRNAGFRAFKVKVGFDLPTDAAATRAAASTLQPGERLFTDANQAWDLASAETFVTKLSGCDIGWLEEPLPVDAHESDWRRLAAMSDIPLAGGENIAGYGEFKTAIGTGALAFYQPDVAKWGGITGCYDIAGQAIAAGHTYCPHFLGGGVGLEASAHLLAAVGGAGLLEIDVNPNPLRDRLADSGQSLRAGCWHVGDAPGLGIEELPGDLAAFETLTISRSL